MLFFAYLRWALDWALQRWGEKWQIRGIGDTAILPLVLLLCSIFGFVITPIMNTYTRTQEYEADMYGLNTSRQPDGFAQAAIHLGEYRKMSPGPVEEWIFFDHPSGRNRIFAAMRWKAENLQLFTPQTGPRSRQRKRGQPRQEMTRDHSRLTADGSTLSALLHHRPQRSFPATSVRRRRRACSPRSPRPRALDVDYIQLREKDLCARELETIWRGQCVEVIAEAEN